GKNGCFLKRRADVQEQQLDDGIRPADSGYGVEPDGCEGRLYIGNATPGEPELIQSPTGNYMAFYDGVYQSITRGLPEPVPADDGVRVMRIIDAAFRSHRDGAVVRC
ncbi:MAG: oxidoreductase, partial [Rhodothermales bacterium]|nr:oxidoreductase [Rhodothermales bacterium]